MAIMPKDGEPRAEKQSALAEPLGRSTGSGRRAPERVRNEPGRRRSRDSGRGRPLASDPGKGEGRNETDGEREELDAWFAGHDAAGWEDPFREREGQREVRFIPSTKAD